MEYIPEFIFIRNKSACMKGKKKTKRRKHNDHCVLYNKIDNSLL